MDKFSNPWSKLTLYSGIFGLLVGIGVWVHGLCLIYSVPIGCLILIRYLRFRHWNNSLLTMKVIGGFITGLLIGIVPIFIYILGNGLSSWVAELFGSAIAVENTSLLIRWGSHLLNLLLFGLTVIIGIRPPWEIRWLLMPLIPIIVGIWMLMIILWIKQLRVINQSIYSFWILNGIFILLIGAFILTPFGNDPSGRYFLPISVIFSLIAAHGIARSQFRRLWQIVIMITLIGYNFGSTLDCALKDPPGLTTQFDSTTIINHSYDAELIEFLFNSGELLGYSNYWVAYPLAFLSDERILYIPSLPYHQDLRYTTRDNRISEYNVIVNQSDSVGYITTNNPKLDRVLQSNFDRLNIKWEEKKIGDYHIFYNLSSKITPTEIELGLSK